MKLLIKLDTNWADEFDVQGFFTTTRKAWDEHLAAVKRYFENSDELELYFGTNEALTFDSYEEYADAYTASELSDEQFSQLVALFGRSYSGEIEFGITARFDEDDILSDDESEEKKQWTPEEVLEHIRDIILVELPDEKEVTSETLIGDLSEDKLVFLDALSAIEFDFEIEIPDDLIEKFKTVQDVADYVTTSVQMNKTFETESL